ncbi:MAG TPA: hypothetical protein VMJ74_15620 [Pseudomonadales bacterium]|nr:hypothetical protein [Pseudomonadales bacterium]
MPRTSKTAPDEWLPNYVRNQALDTLTPSERIQFRIACGRGTTAVAAWADATLPKYPVLWRRLKSAQRQRRFRAVPNTEKWMTDWRVAERTFGKALTDLLRRNRPRLELPAKATPADVLGAALMALDTHLNEPRSRGDALPPRSAPPAKDH